MGVLNFFLCVYIKGMALNILLLNIQINFGYHYSNYFFLQKMLIQHTL
jgi:hypothetical protein